MTIRTMLGLIILSLTSVGCLTVGSSFRQYGLERAAFEMQCPREQLNVVCLNCSLDGSAYAGSQVGVTGCNKRMVFVNTTTAGWVANSASQ